MHIKRRSTPAYLYHICIIISRSAPILDFLFEKKQ